MYDSGQGAYTMQCLAKCVGITALAQVQVLSAL
jgi:hypothetical protein